MGPEKVLNISRRESSLGGYMCVCNKVKEVFPVHGNICILGKGMDQLICAMVVTKTMEFLWLLR